MPVYGRLLLEFYHLIIRLGHGNHRKTRTETTAEVLLIHLLLQGYGRACVDVVPSHMELIHRGIRVLIHLSVLLIVEGLQLHALLVDPGASALQSNGIIQLRIEGEHVQLNLLAIYDFFCIEHILNQLAIGSAGWMDSDNTLWLIFTLLVRSFLLLILLIAVESSQSRFIRSLYGSHEDIADIISHRLIRSRMSYDEQRTIQPPFPFRAVIEPVGASGHQRHHGP